MKFYCLAACFALTFFISWFAPYLSFFGLNKETWALIAFIVFFIVVAGACWSGFMTFFLYRQEINEMEDGSND